MPRRLTAAQIWDRLEAKGLATGVRPPDHAQRKQRRQEESEMQRKVVRWFDLTARARWSLSPLVLLAIPNAGMRGPAAAAILKAEGLRAGAPDLLLLVPSANGNQVKINVLSSVNSAQAIDAVSDFRDYHGLALELKTPSGRVAPKQEAYHAILREQGYRVEVVRSFDAAVEIISNYLDGK